jgi:hypothetical protein
MFLVAFTRELGEKELWPPRKSMTAAKATNQRYGTGIAGMTCEIWRMNQFPRFSVIKK